MDALEELLEWNRNYKDEKKRRAKNNKRLQKLHEEMDNDSRYFEHISVALRLYRGNYTFKVDKVEYEFIHRYGAGIFSSISPPEKDKVIESALRKPILYLFDELGIDRKYIHYVKCHKGEFHTYSIRIPNLSTKEAMGIFRTIHL